MEAKFFLEQAMEVVEFLEKNQDLNDMSPKELEEYEEKVTIFLQKHVLFLMFRHMNSTSDKKQNDLIVYLDLKKETEKLQKTVDGFIKETMEKLEKSWR